MTDGVALAERFDRIHELIYSKGGIRPVNAAIEELAKYLLIALWYSRDKNAEIEGRSLADVLFAPRPDARYLKAAFAQANSSGEFASTDPLGASDSLWPDDEPLRLVQPEIAREVIDALVPVVEAPRALGDPLGLAFDVFLRGRYDHAGGLGTFLTPEAVTRAMSRMALQIVDVFGRNPKRGQLVFGDPCAGTGRFLVSLLQEAEAHYGHEDRQTLKRWGSHVFAADQSPSSIAKARLNLLLYGVDSPRAFVVDDSITSAALDALSGSVRLILTNPPFGEGAYDSLKGLKRARTWLPEIPRKERIDPALAFVGRCLSLLEDGGVAGIVLPDGIVDGPVLRKTLEHENLDVDPLHVSLEAVVSLPKATFAPSGTAAKTSVVFLRRQSRSSGFVFLATSKHVGLTKIRGKIAADPDGNDLPTVCEAFSAFRQDPPNESIVLRTEPVVVAWPSPPPYVTDAARAKELIASSEASGDGATLGDLLDVKKASRAAAQEGVPFISVLHIDELGCLAWEEVLGHNPKTPGLSVVGGDVIVSLLNPSKLRAAVVPVEIDRAVVSAEFGVFSSRVDPYAVVALLYQRSASQQLAPLGRGTSSSRRRINESDVLNVRVPAMEPREIQELGERWRELTEAVRRSRVSLRSMMDP